MDFTAVGNLHTYLKNYAMQTRWSLKQQTGNLTAKGGDLDQWLQGDAAQQPDAAAPGAQTDERLREIQAKLDAGSKLTPDEREYLQAKDPQTYRELVAQENEQKAYESALRRCKTKEEAQRLQVNRVNQSMTVVRAVEHNPHIPLQKKLEIAMREKRRVDDVAESTRKFVKSGAYDALPTQAEQDRAQQAQADRLHPAQPHQADQVPETGRPEEKPAPQKPEPETPEERKVRRARAKAAYAALSGPHAAGHTELDRQA